ncbi:MAG: ATP-binding protein, partial [Betaproteobacteria bacterium]|nr:ATP-binding protein [Betaproteobacteria bacterium]
GLEGFRPVFRIRTKVFVIGALVPLLIDTMLVQYYWTRTGYFSMETLGVWLLLEVIAIGGSLVFARSFGQSVAPLRSLLEAPRPLPPGGLQGLSPASTDELGALTGDYNRLLRELQWHQEHLEQVVHERTSQLESANRELEAFSYSVSHDLRTPLRAIDGFSRILLEDHGDQLDEEGRSHLQRVRSATQRMGSLIDAILKMAHMSRMELQPDEVDLSALAAEIAADLRAGDPHRQVAFRIAPGLRAHGDVRLLRTVLGNLIENSWKYTRDTPEPAIEVGAGIVNGKAAFHVRDNGAGFDMRFSDRLFGAFERLHGAEYPGEGVGLATVERIVRRHGGEVWADGEVGQGSTFFFTLPGKAR